MTVSILLPLSGITASVNIGHGSLTVSFPVIEIAIINIAVGIMYFSHAVIFAVNPLPVVFKAG